MSPIDQSTIRAEKWTKSDGEVIKQVVAEGTEETPGTYVWERGINKRAVNLVNKEKRIVDINVDEDGKIGLGQYLPTRFGVWKKLNKKES